MTTIILCSRNGAKFIRKQLDSILREKVCEYRVLVFDDRSQDGTVDILREYKKRYPKKFDYVVRPVSSGSSCANLLMAVAEAPKSDYYMLSDQDDVWHEDKMRKMIASVSAHESIDGKDTPILVHSDATVFRSVEIAETNTIELIDIADSFMEYEGLSPRRVGFNQLLLQNQVTGGGCIFNYALKKLVEDAAAANVEKGGKPYPERALIHDQWLAILCAAFGKIYYFDEALYDYRQHADNQIGAKKASFIDETKRRLGFGELNKSEMDLVTRGEFLRIYAQAEQFRKTYGDMLDPKKKRQLDEFCKMDSRSKLGKVTVLLANGFTFNKFYRTVGEILFI